MLVSPPMAILKMSIRTDCAISACSPLPLPIKALAHWLLVGELAFRLESTLPLVAGIWNRAKFHFHQRGLFTGFWTASSRTSLSVTFPLGTSRLMKSGSLVQFPCLWCSVSLKSRNGRRGRTLDLLPVNLLPVNLDAQQQLRGMTQHPQASSGTCGVRVGLVGRSSDWNRASDWGPRVGNAEGSEKAQKIYQI